MGAPKSNDPADSNGYFVYLKQLIADYNSF